MALGEEFGKKSEKILQKTNEECALPIGLS